MHMGLTQGRTAMELPVPAGVASIIIGCDSIYFDGKQVHLRGPLDFTYITLPTDAAVEICVGMPERPHPEHILPPDVVRCPHSIQDWVIRDGWVLCTEGCGRVRRANTADMCSTLEQIITEPISEEGLIAAVEKLARDAHTVEGAERGALCAIIDSITRFRGCHDGQHFYAPDATECYCGNTGLAASDD